MYPLEDQKAEKLETLYFSEILKIEQNALCFPPHLMNLNNFTYHDFLAWYQGNSKGSMWIKTKKFKINNIHYGRGVSLHFGPSWPTVRRGFIPAQLKTNKQELNILYQISLPQNPKNHWLLTTMSFNHEKLLV